MEWKNSRSVRVLAEPSSVNNIGALCISVLLSLVATPVAYYVLRSFKKVSPPG